MGHTANQIDQYRYEDQVDVAARFYPVLMAIMRSWDDLVNFGFILGQWEMASTRQIPLNGNTRRFFVNLVLDTNEKIVDFLRDELFSCKHLVDERIFGELTSSIVHCYIEIGLPVDNYEEEIKKQKKLSAEYHRIYREIIRGGGGND